GGQNLRALERRRWHRHEPALLLMLVTIDVHLRHTAAVASVDDADVTARLERIKKLCDELEQAQHDTRTYKELIDRIRDEANAFRRTLATHDPASDESGV